MKRLNRKNIVEINGEQVFSADWTFEQMQAQSCRIDRSNRIALISIAVAVIVVILAIVL